MLMALLIVAVLGLAYANGANDNFKGVATLYGSGTMSFRRTLTLATVATVLGSAVSIFLAEGLARSFSGKGLVPDALTSDPAFLVSVAGAGAITIMLATRLGLPTSTTHALTGALFGIAFSQSASFAGAAVLWSSFLQPLLVSPIVAILGAGGLYYLFARARRRLGVEADSCICVNETANAANAAPAPATPIVEGGELLLERAPAMTVTLGKDAACAETTSPGIRLGARRLLDSLHGLSAVSVCFARAVNDTPKIAVLWIATAATPSLPLFGATLAMAAGGLLSARRVAETMSKRITTMNPGQGATSNFVTAAIVLGASRFGLPVSTTHVSCGAIMGIGATTRQANGHVVRQLLMAWLVTLPLGAALGSGLFLLLRH